MAKRIIADFGHADEETAGWRLSLSGEQHSGKIEVALFWNDKAYATHVWTLTEQEIRNALAWATSEMEK